MSVDSNLNGAGGTKARRDAQAKTKTGAKAKREAPPTNGVKLARRYTAANANVFDTIRWDRRDSMITNPDGSVVFATRGVEIPATWSQLATDIVVSKYFRKSGLNGQASLGETSVRQVVYRIAHTLREAGEARGYFADREAADTFEDELTFMLVNQYGAFNSPVWFNCGLYQRYGIKGSGGNYAWDEANAKVYETTGAYERPQCSACFIQAVRDDLMSIFDLVKNEARLFKYGSGTGTNFSTLRGRQEKLSGGGTSSGLMSFLEVLDRAAGSTKSGGTTRRAAKMVCLDMDHPEIVDFIEWKMKEERKAQALISMGYPSDFNGEAYHTVSGQNSNNSVRVTDDFMSAVENDGPWSTRFRTNGAPGETFRARDLWRKLAESAWACADPGVQYDTTINTWHTCAGTGKINASNPCSEYMFLDDTACNLSSLNLTKFLRENADGTLDFDVEAYRHAVRIFFLAQEILVDFSSYPTTHIAKNSHDYRPLGLGYANLGTLLMLMGLPYDSDQGRAVAASLTAIMTGGAFRTSAEIAAVKGPFAGYAKNAESMLRVISRHRDAAYAIPANDCPATLYAAARVEWDEALRLGQQFGYRNAQATVLAPTGTIGLLMDCDTTGIEPDFAIVKFKKLAGGGYFKIVNASVERALIRLGYSAAESTAILAHVSGTNTFLGSPHVSREFLKSKGLLDDEIRRAEDALRGAFTLNQVLGMHVIGEAAYDRIGVSRADANVPGFSLLRHFGLTSEQIDEASDHIIGRMTVEGAPHLKQEHYAVFDCANRCGTSGKRFLAPMAHLRMMAAAQPFLSGAISKTVNLPNEATVEDIEKIYFEGWKLGLKAVALYRDGCKASQPLSSGGKKEEASVGDAEISARNSTPPAADVTSEYAEDNGPLFAKAPMLGPKPTTRYRLPKRRGGFTQEAKIGGHKVFLRTGEYEDRGLGEIFIDMHKEGAAFRSLMNCFAISVSMGLQHGVSLEEFVEQFTFTRFEPQGTVEGHENVKFSTSIVDYVFRVLGVEYLERYDLAHVPPEHVRQQITTATDASVPVDAQTTSLNPPAPSAPPYAAASYGGSSAATAAGEMNKSLSKMMKDAPMCDQCGHITVRNGSCYRCLNCGASMGCS